MALHGDGALCHLRLGATPDTMHQQPRRGPVRDTIAARQNATLPCRRSKKMTKFENPTLEVCGAQNARLSAKDPTRFA